MPVLALLALCLFCKLADWSLDRHEEMAYDRHDVAMVSALATAEDEAPKAAPMRLVHPKTERERAELIAMIWLPEIQKGKR